MEFIKANRDAEEIIVPSLTLPAWSETFIGRRTWTYYTIHGGDLNSKFEHSHNVMFA